MYNTKMKPLHSTKSFHSWRSSIERNIDEGYTYSEVKPGQKMPKRFSRYLKEVKAKRERLGLNSYRNSDQNTSRDDKQSESAFEGS